MGMPVTLAFGQLGSGLVVDAQAVQRRRDREMPRVSDPMERRDTSALPVRSAGSNPRTTRICREVRSACRSISGTWLLAQLTPKCTCGELSIVHVDVELTGVLPDEPRCPPAGVYAARTVRI